jgi:hypothetical protein
VYEYLSKLSLETPSRPVQSCGTVPQVWSGAAPSSCRTYVTRATYLFTSCDVRWIEPRYRPARPPAPARLFACVTPIHSLTTHRHSSCYAHLLLQWRICCCGNNVPIFFSNIVATRNRSSESFSLHNSCTSFNWQQSWLCRVAVPLSFICWQRMHRGCRHWTPWQRIWPCWKYGATDVGPM